MTDYKIKYLRVDGDIQLRSAGISEQKHVESPLDDFLHRCRRVCSSAFCVGSGISDADFPRLNGLTVANRVHLLEPQWNPAVENQAIGRVLRLGQERKVTIIRYAVEKTIEEVSGQSEKILCGKTRSVDWALTNPAGSRIKANTEAAVGWWRFPQQGRET